MPRSVIEDQLLGEVVEAMSLPDMALEVVVDGVVLLAATPRSPG